MAEELNGAAAKIDARALNDYVDKEGTDPNYINGTESILSTRLEEENYFELITLMKAFAWNTSIDDIGKAIVGLKMTAHSFKSIFNF